MTVRLRSDRHPLFGPGFALLVFDQPIGVPRLDLSILNTVTGLYLGPSIPGRPSWIKQQTTFFPAIRAGGEGSKIFRIGPEVTFYIQEGTYVEIASADGSMREELSWEGVLLRSSLAGTENWASRPEAFELGPDGPATANSGPAVHAPDLDKVRRDEQEAILSKQRQEDRLRAEKSAALAVRQAGEKAQEFVGAAAVERSPDPAIRVGQEEDLRRAELAAAAAFSKQEVVNDLRKPDAAPVIAKSIEEEVCHHIREDRLGAHEAVATQPAASDTCRTAEDATTGQLREGEKAHDAPEFVESAEAVRKDDQALSTLRAEGPLPLRRRSFISAVIWLAGGASLAFVALATIVFGSQELSEPGYLCQRYGRFCSPNNAARVSTPTQKRVVPPAQKANLPAAQDSVALSMQNTVTPSTQSMVPPPAQDTAPVPTARPAASSCTTRSMGSYGRPTEDRIRAYIATHKAMRLAPNSDPDRIAREQCFAGKDDYARSYFAIWATSVSSDNPIPGDLVSEFNAELAATIKPTDDPNLRLPEPPPAADAKSSPSNSQRRRR